MTPVLYHTKLNTYKLIYFLRMAKNLSQVQLAEAHKVSVPTYSRLENEGVELTYCVFKVTCEIYGLSMNEWEHMFTTEKNSFVENLSKKEIINQLKVYLENREPNLKPPSRYFGMDNDFSVGSIM